MVSTGKAILGHMREPLAYFLTWPTYGTWLHGDERGSVDRAHNTPGTPLIEPNSRRVRAESKRLTCPPVELDSTSRKIGSETISDHCRQRGWDLFANSARSNHVHVVVGVGDRTPERIMGEFKAWATRRLRQAGRVGPKARVWAYHGSTRYLWDSKSLNAASGYVTEGQDVPR